VKVLLSLMLIQKTLLMDLMDLMDLKDLMDLEPEDLTKISLMNK
jgi:hypothetical protein